MTDFSTLVEQAIAVGGSHKQVKQKNLKNRLLIIASILLLAALFFISPFYPFIRSLAVMGIYNKIQEQDSLIREEGIHLDIPGGLITGKADWYPFTLTFTANELYAKYIGETDTKLTILYNFPSFAYLKGCSRLYDPQSVYYNSFYGAYLVRDSSNVSLANGKLDADKVADIAKFDFFHLVLGEFGLQKEDESFDFMVTERQNGIELAGYPDWTRIISQITVNGSAHNKREGVTSYLQYGAPGFGIIEWEFEPVSMYGIVYGRYFPEWDTGIYFYILGDEQVCYDWEKEILPNIILESRR